MFKIKTDFKQFDKYTKLVQTKAIGVIKRSIRATVNDQAFATRKKAVKVEIPRTMTIRSRFNLGLIRVETAKGRSLTAEVGAINRANYFGLRNIELSKPEKNTAIPHLQEVRGGSKQKKVTASKRLGKLGSFVTIKGSSSKLILSRLSKSGYGGYFKVIGKRTKLNPGIYKFRGKGVKERNKGFLRRKLEWVRDTEHPKTKPKKNQWLKRSTLRGASAGVTSLFWRRNQDRFLKKAYDRALK